MRRLGLQVQGKLQAGDGSGLPGQVRVRAGTEETGAAGLAGAGRGGGDRGAGQHRVQAAVAGAGLQGEVAPGGGTQHGLPGGRAGAGRAGGEQVGGADRGCAGLGAEEDAAGRGQKAVQQWALYLEPGRTGPGMVRAGGQQG